MFSGNCFVNKDGRPTMCYHQVGQGNAMAVAVDDELNEWKKLDSNPITPKTEPGDPHHDKYRSWDPYGWLEGDTYYAIFGGERPGIAKAPSLAGQWKYVGDLMANSVDGVSINEDVSCADFFKIGDKHMLLCISHRLGCRYYLGDWKDEQFHPDVPREDELGGQLVLRPREPAGRPGPPHHVGLDLRRPGLQDARRLRLVRHDEPAARPLARRGRHAAHEPAGGNRTAALQRKEEGGPHGRRPTPNWRWKASAATASSWTSR